MKKGILFLFILASLTTKAQSLKDLLYSGKLKSDSNSVVRKTDDLKSKIDTTQRKPAEVQTTVIAVIPADSMKKTSVAVTENKAVDNKTATGNKAASGTVTADVVVGSTAAAVIPPPPPPPAKTNTKIWKEYTDAYATTMKSEELKNKKVKKDTYTFTIEYELDPTGKVNVTNVTVLPENALLASQVKDHIESSPPQLNADPNQTKVLKKRQNFYVTKE